VDKRKDDRAPLRNGCSSPTKNVKRLVDAGPVHLFLSLDSHIPEEHDRLRGFRGSSTGDRGAPQAQENGVFIGYHPYASRSGTARGDYKKMYELAQRIGAHQSRFSSTTCPREPSQGHSELLTMDQRGRRSSTSPRHLQRREIPPLTSRVAEFDSGVSGRIGWRGGLHTVLTSPAYGTSPPAISPPSSFGNMREEPIRKIWKRMIRHPAYRPGASSAACRTPAFRHFLHRSHSRRATLPYDVGSCLGSITANGRAATGDRITNPPFRVRGKRHLSR